MFQSIRSLMSRVALVAALIPAAALAQQDLTRVIVPLGPGNPFDASARALAQGLAKVSGQNVIVENKAGAGGRIATTDVAKARPDGSVLLFTTAGHATNAGLYKNLPYDPVEDFTPITIVSKSSGFALLVQADSPYKTVQDLVAAARANPNKISYGSFGIGNTTHVIAALFAREAKLDLIHVPYKSPVSDFLGGHVNMLFMGASTALPLIQDGRVRALAISSEAPDPNFPGVPTFRELDYHDVDVPAWSGMLAPRGMPADQVETLFKQISEAARLPVFQDYLKLSKANLVLMTPQEFSKALQADIARFRKVLPELGIEAE